ncbi:hypothetical protein HPB51_003206 [Rhipicephalus microplus]|uniref:Uncharacterized protein n=1 Tax=Rhipicephalus microplus TaxID=6941 RepID=A0A9J6EKV8_RHIMP|nr:hypothetical protein HPB51_003206 [Rhipicephalus microplus]
MGLLIVMSVRFPCRVPLAGPAPVRGSAHQAGQQQAPNLGHRFCDYERALVPAQVSRPVEPRHWKLLVLRELHHVPGGPRHRASRRLPVFHSGNKEQLQVRQWLAGWHLVRQAATTYTHARDGGQPSRKGLAMVNGICGSPCPRLCSSSMAAEIVRRIAAVQSHGENAISEMGGANPFSAPRRSPPRHQQSRRAFGAARLGNFCAAASH